MTDRADVGPANDGNVSIAAVHSVNVDEWLASFGRSSGRRAVCTVFLSQAQLATLVGAARKAVVYQWEARKRTPSPVFWQRITALHR